MTTVEYWLCTPQLREKIKQLHVHEVNVHVTPIKVLNDQFLFLASPEIADIRARAFSGVLHRQLF